MAATTAHLKANTNSMLSKTAKSASDETSHTQTGFWRLFANAFWKYTENQGAADTSSYRGLL
ncbi:MAG: hypothetical protein NXI27_17535 [Alphaproteobacteria bacterium]|nr:hypothetical protein [Alphaproteobacteria bacterium]